MLQEKTISVAMILFYVVNISVLLSKSVLELQLQPLQGYQIYLAVVSEQFRFAFNAIRDNFRVGISTLFSVTIPVIFMRHFGKRLWL